MLLHAIRTVRGGITSAPAVDVQLNRVLFAALLAGAGVASGQASAQPSGAVVGIQVTDSDHTHLGTAFAIHETRLEGARAVYFVTAARLFDVPVGHRAALRLPSGDDAIVEHTDIFVPGQSRADVAVLRVRTDDPRVKSVPIVLTPATAGQAFEVTIAGRDGSLDVSAGHLAAVTTRALRTDRPLARTAGCLGAPVSRDGTVFALVADCDAGVPPTFVPFSAVRSFLTRHVPGLAP